MNKFDFRLLLGVLKKDDVVYPHLPQIPAVKQARDEKHSVWDEGAPDTIILRDTGGNVRAYTYKGNDYFWMHWPNQVTFRFSGDEMDVLAYEETPQDEIFLTDLFWRNVVPFVLQAQGWEAIHASSVLTSKGVVAFCASSGTGKSTIAYGLSRRGYGLWGDDAVVFTTSPEGTLTFPLHFQLRLLGDTRDYYDIEPFSHTHAQKTPILVNRVNTDKPEGLRSIFLLERTDGEPDFPGLRIEEFKGVEAVKLLLKHAYVFSLYQKNDRKRLLLHYLDLVEQVPIYKGLLAPGLANLEQKLDLFEEYFS